MDKELLRVVIIAIGLIVVIVMLAYSYIKNRNAERESDLFDDLDINGDIDESLIVHGDHDDFDVVPKKSSRYDDDFVEDISTDDVDFDDDDYEVESKPRFVSPDIIQFSVIAKAGATFNGTDLLKAFAIAGLEYGNLKIFERLDAEGRLVDFGVANMEKPGTFPEDGLDDYFCRGIVFFMQPDALEEPLVIFDDFIDTIRLVSAELDGDILDHQREPLTEETILLFRQSL